MNQVSQTPKRSWQFGVRTLLLTTTVAAILTGVFFGTFGESVRKTSVDILVEMSRVILPLATIAVYALIGIGAVRLLARIFRKWKQT